MSRPTLSWPAIRRRFCVTSNRPHRGVTMNTSNNIPFLDLVTPHVELEQELTAVFRRALRTADFIGGPMVSQFEKAFAAFCNTSHSIAVGSGTDALRFAI